MRFVVVVLLGLVVFLRLDKELWWFIRERKEQRERRENREKGDYVWHTGPGWMGWDGMDGWHGLQSTEERGAW